MFVLSIIHRGKHTAVRVKVLRSSKHNMNETSLEQLLDEVRLHCYMPQGASKRKL